MKIRFLANDEHFTDYHHRIRVAIVSFPGVTSRYRNSRGSPLRCESRRLKNSISDNCRNTSRIIGSGQILRSHRYNWTRFALLFSRETHPKPDNDVDPVDFGDFRVNVILFHFLRSCWYIHSNYSSSMEASFMFIDETLLSYFSELFCHIVPKIRVNSVWKWWGILLLINSHSRNWKLTYPTL